MHEQMIDEGKKKMREREDNSLNQQSRCSLSLSFALPGSLEFVIYERPPPLTKNNTFVNYHFSLDDFAALKRRYRV
jgi:hypothetical protein